MGFDVSYPAAALAGLLSFVSPCVLPLVPPYLGFLGGVTLDQMTAGREADPRAARRVFYAAVAFVLGFITVFVALGATASAISQVLIANAEWVGRIAGTIIVVFGLHMMGLFRIGFLNREARVHVERRPAGLIGAYFIGLAFAFGWTPCVGPVLAAILTVAAGRESAWEGAALLATYGLGIGIPFLIAALFARSFMAFTKRIRPYMRAVELSLGGLLVATGGLIFFGSFSEIGYWLLRAFPALGRVG
ncbi:MAG: sulfite exporter TauE/SafE family protein [Rhodospirillales bacterium]|nr:sulfite exporter TauE/SafE family protein [Rhodospirillales bacterium]